MLEKEYYILYLDVLGYKAMLEEDSHKLFNKINTGFMYLNRESEIRNMKCKIFSDNIILGIDAKETDALEKLLKYTAKVQELFLRRYGILFRGSIVKGMMYFGSVYIYGKGIIDAYNLEQKVLFPRVIIDKNLHNEAYVLSSTHTVITYRDDEKFINFMIFYHPNVNHKKSRKQNLIKLLNNTVEFYNKNVSSSDKKLVAKVLWICNYMKYIFHSYSLESHFDLTNHPNFKDWNIFLSIY